MKARIVKFGDKYALERGRKMFWGRTIWTGRYRDFQSPQFWWGKGSRYFKDCLTDLESVECFIAGGHVVREVEIDF